MGRLAEWRGRWQEWRAARFVSHHQAEVLGLLAQRPEVAMPLMDRWLEARATRLGPERETTPYPVLTSAGLGSAAPLARAVPKPVPFALRKFSESPPARRAINAITQTIADMPWQIVVRQPAGMSQAPTVTAEQQARIAAATAMLQRPNQEQSGRELFEMVLEDLTVFGGGCLEAQANRTDQRPLFLFPVDTQSIRINMQWKPGAATYHYAQGQGYSFGSQGGTDEIKLRDDELLYMKLNNRTHTPFGLGFLEVAFETVNAYMGAFSYAERRASNNTPNFGLFLGENISIEQVRKWQHYWENEIEGNGKVPIIGGGRQPSVFSMTGTGEDQLWLKWQEFLIRVIAMSFGLSPMKLGLERDVNRSTASTQASNDWATVAPVANTVQDSLTSWLLWRRLGWTDLEFQWQIRTTDEERQAAILMEQYRMNAITVNELRQFYKRPPLEEGLGELTKTAYEMAIKAAAMGQVGVGGPEAPIGADTDHLSGAAHLDDDLGPLDAAFRAHLRREVADLVAEHLAA